MSNYFNALLGVNKYRNNMYSEDMLGKDVLTNALTELGLNELEVNEFISQLDIQYDVNTIIINGTHIKYMENYLLNIEYLEESLLNFINLVNYDNVHGEILPSNVLPEILNTLNIDVVDGYNYRMLNKNMEILQLKYYNNYAHYNWTNSLLFTLLTGVVKYNNDLKYTSFNNLFNYLLNCTLEELDSIYKGSPFKILQDNKYLRTDIGVINSEGIVEFTQGITITINNEKCYNLKYSFNYDILSGEYTYNHYKLNHQSKLFSGFEFIFDDEFNTNYFLYYLDSVKVYLNAVFYENNVDNYEVYFRNISKKEISENLFNGSSRLYKFYYYGLNILMRNIVEIAGDIKLIFDLENNIITVKHNENQFDLEYIKRDELRINIGNTSFFTNNQNHSLSDNVVSLMNVAKFLLIHSNNENVEEIIKYLVISEGDIKLVQGRYYIDVTNIIINTNITTPNYSVMYLGKRSTARKYLSVKLSIIQNKIYHHKYYNLNNLDEVIQFKNDYLLLSMV